MPCRHPLDLVITISDVVATNLYVGATIADHALLKLFQAQCRGVCLYLPMATNATWSFFLGGGGVNKKFNIKL